MKTILPTFSTSIYREPFGDIDITVKVENVYLARKKDVESGEDTHEISFSERAKVDSRDIPTLPQNTTIYLTKSDLSDIENNYLNEIGI